MFRVPELLNYCAKVFGVSARVVVQPSVIYRDVSGEFVLLNLQSGVYYGLDAIGSRMWQLLTEQRDVDEVCAILIDEYETSSDVLRADVDRLVSELAEKGLVSIHRSAEPV
jgi:hypothetical protein